MAAAALRRELQRQAYQRTDVRGSVHWKRLVVDVLCSAIAGNHRRVPALMQTGKSTRSRHLYWREDDYDD